MSFPDAESGATGKGSNSPQEKSCDQSQSIDTPSTPQIIVQDEPEQVSSPTPSPSSTSMRPDKLNGGTKSGNQDDENEKGQQSSTPGGSSNTVSSSTPNSPLLSSKTYSGGGFRSPLGGGNSNDTQRKTTDSYQSKKGGVNSNRTSSFEYKETLNATTRHLEDGSRIINQYKLGKMIGKGAYGSVYSATLVDDNNTFFAVKEFGKTRLRKTYRAQNFRRPTRGRGRGRGAPMRGGKPIKEIENSESGGGHLGGEEEAQSPSSGLNALKLGDDGGDADESNSQKSKPEDPLSLIRREIAILKKLHHPHLVHLYEVLDDPTKDELYMVFEYCPDGAVIDIRLHEQVDPLKEDVARNYLVQIMLGVEYLHHHDIVHRDLKPDNILLQNDRKTCKIVDFGVSEFFIKPGDDTMQKSAGSPAFMSPELCKAGHGDFHGKDSDLWSLGVTFYCMVVGHLPFDKSQFLELYESIQGDAPRFPSHLSDNCKDLLHRMLNKNPSERITIQQMRSHPFITNNGKDEVISMEDNIRDLVEEVTAEELDSAINRIASVFTLARAISKFKRAGSRASSAGSLTDVTSSILKKGKEVSQQGTAAVKEWNSTRKSKEGEEKEKESEEDRGHDKSRSESQPDEPSLEHMAEAHVVMGTSNRQWAAEHIARAVMHATGYGKGKSSEGEGDGESESSKPKEIRRKKSNEGEDEENDEEGNFKDNETDENASKVPNRREEVLHFSPNELDASSESDYFGKQVEQHKTSDPLSGLREHSQHHSPNHPKLLPDQPTVHSPAYTSLPTPKQAAAAYKGKRASD